MIKASILLGLVLFGCGGGSKFAGTYRAASGPELILSGDGSYRYLIGERTSAQDSFGTYVVAGDTISFKNSGGTSRFTEAKLTKDGFALKTTDGKDWLFARE